jgi:hypothetical protein
LNAGIHHEIEGINFLRSSVMKRTGSIICVIGTVVCFSIGIASVASAAGGEVKVRVYDSATKPVGGATVEFYKQQPSGAYKLCICVNPGPAGRCEKAPPDASAQTSKNGKAEVGLKANSKYMAVVNGKCVCSEQACLKDADCKWQADKGGGKSPGAISTNKKGGSAKTTEITLTPK